jgi:hypothetical protein
MPSDLPDAPAVAGRWRFRVYFAWSLAVCVVWLVLLLGGGPAYDPDRRPDLLDFALTVWSFVLIPALYGLFALVVLLQGAGRAGRGFLIGAVMIGVVATAMALWFALTFSGIDCRPDCVAAVPDPGYYKVAYAVSLIPAVVMPLLFAVVRWPAAPSPPVRTTQHR